MKLLIHTLGHFVKALLTGPSSNSQTSAELHCAVSELSDHVLLPRITQNLTLSPGSLHCAIRESTRLIFIQNSVEVAQQVISIYASRKHINQASSWSTREFDQAVTPRLTPLKTCSKYEKHAGSTDWRNCTNMPEKHLVSIIICPQKLRNFSN